MQASGGHSELTRSDFRARFDERSLEVHAKAHWLPTLGVGLLATVFVVSGTFGVILGFRNAWMALAAGVPLMVGLVVSHRQTAKSFFRLDLDEGASSLSYYLFRPEVREVSANALRPQAGGGAAVDVRIELAKSTGPDTKTVEGLKASVTFYVDTDELVGKWMFRIDTIEHRAEELKAFLSPVVSSLGAQLPPTVSDNLSS